MFRDSYTRNNIKCPYCRKENNESDLSLIIYLKLILFYLKTKQYKKTV